MIAFVSVNTTGNVSIVGGLSARMFARTVNDVIMTAFARLSRRTRANPKISIDSCCPGVVLVTYEVDDQKSRWRRCDVIVMASTRK